MDNNTLTAKELIISTINQIKLHRDIFVFGTTRSGKSVFVNALITLSQKSNLTAYSLVPDDLDIDATSQKIPHFILTCDVLVVDHLIPFHINPSKNNGCFGVFLEILKLRKDNHSTLIVSQTQKDIMSVSHVFFRDTFSLDFSPLPFWRYSGFEELSAPDMTANLRVNRDKWQIFQSLAKSNNSDASKEIRGFIDAYLSNSNK